MGKVIFVLNDGNQTQIKALAEKIYLKVKKYQKTGVAWEVKEKESKKPYEENNADVHFKYSKVEFFNNCVLVKNFNFLRDIKEKGKAEVTAIHDYFKHYGCSKNSFKIFLCVDNYGLKKNDLTKLVKKSKGSSGSCFYNFGRSYLMNKTFFDSGYSLYGENIAHEAINVFKADDTNSKGNRYFYLCDDGKIDGYFSDLDTLDKLPDNYFDLEKTELINYSKFEESENSKTKYIILQKVEGITPFFYRYSKNYEKFLAKCESIKYNNVKLIDIISTNKFARKDKEGNLNEVDETKTYPCVSFYLNDNGKVYVPKDFDKASFLTDVEGYEGLKGQSLKRMLIENTNEFEKIDGLLSKDNLSLEEPQKLEDYIKSDDYENDYEEDSLLNLIGKNAKETFFSKIIAYVFSKNKVIFESYIKDIIKNITVSEIVKVYNESYNMDVCVIFKDNNGEKHIAVIENKIDADLTPKGKMGFESYFNKKNESQKIVKKVNSELTKAIKSDKNKIENQLTKYYLICNVLAEMEKIKKDNIHYLLLGPKYHFNKLDREKDNFYFGDCYKTTSYLSLFNSLSAFLNSNEKDTLRQDELDIVKQLYRSIWPYISDSYTYFLRRSKNRFARVAERLCNENKTKE